MQDGRAEIGIAGRVAATAGESLPDAPATVNEHLVEAAPVRLVFRLVAQVPLAEDARAVAGALEHLRECRGIEREPLPLVNGVGDSITELVPSRVQGRARRRTGGADVEIRKPHRLVVEPVEVGRLQARVAVAG